MFQKLFILLRASLPLGYLIIEVDEGHIQFETWKNGTEFCEGLKTDMSTKRGLS